MSVSATKNKPDNAMRALLTAAAELWDGEIEIRVKNLATGEVTEWTWDRKERKPIRRGQQ